MAEGAVSVDAYAKINLSMEVRGRLPSGYHSVRTVMHQIGLSDLVAVEVSRGRPSCQPPGAALLPLGSGAGGGGAWLALSASGGGAGPAGGFPLDGGNLAARAAGAFIDACMPGFCGGVSVRVEKNIPVAAGLGGGSSDAAAVLLGLAAITRAPGTGLRKLMGLGARIGADVPFCVMGLAAMNPALGFSGDPAASSCALAEGIGELLTPLPPVSGWALLSKPPIPVSTSRVYGGLDPAEMGERPDTDGMVEGVRRGDCAKIIKNMVNMLEIAAIKEYPEIKRARSDLESSGLSEKMLMSGSGSAFFALYRDGDACAHDARLLAARLPDSEVFVARLL
jgi:4-diphosphocytidyl-2-C-methyl-D-erythritol kinase